MAARLNHQRPILQLMDARKRGLAISGPVGKLVTKYLPSKAHVVRSAAPKPKKPTVSERQLMHEVAVAILDHIDNHGDYTDAYKLAGLASGGSERDAIRQWFTRYSKISFDARTEKFRYDRTKQSDRAAGLANPFWKLKRKSSKSLQPREFRLADQLVALVSKARQQQETLSAHDMMADAGLLDDIEGVMRRHGIYIIE